MRECRRHTPDWPKRKQRERRGVLMYTNLGLTLLCNRSDEVCPGIVTSDMCCHLCPVEHRLPLIGPEDSSNDPTHYSPEVFLPRASPGGCFAFRLQLPTEPAKVKASYYVVDPWQSFWTSSTKRISRVLDEPRHALPNGLVSLTEMLIKPKGDSRRENVERTAGSTPIGEWNESTRTFETFEMQAVHLGVQCQMTECVMEWLGVRGQSAVAVWPCGCGARALAVYCLLSARRSESQATYHIPSPC